MQLEALFQPRSIAVIGASEKPTVGRRVVASLDRIGFTGRIYPVNPSYPIVLGHACYASMPSYLRSPISRYSAWATRGFSGPLSRRRSVGPRAR